MGFFDKLKKAINIDSTNDFVNKIEQAFSTDEESSTTYTYQSEARRYSPPAARREHIADKRAYRALAEKLENTFATEYSNYTVRKDVPATEIAGSRAARNYTYGLYDCYGQPAAFIMLMVDRNDYARNAVRLAKEAAENQRIPYMNFMYHLPNEQSYISDRLRKNIYR